MAGTPVDEPRRFPAGERGRSGSVAEAAAAVGADDVKKDEVVGVALSAISAEYRPGIREEDEGKELKVTTITLYKSRATDNLGQLIGVSTNYICYAVRDGLVRAINQTTAQRTLIRGHTRDVSDIQCFASTDAESDVVVTVAEDGQVLVWSLTDAVEPFQPEEGVIAKKLFSAEHPDRASGGRYHRVRCHPTSPTVFATAGSHKDVVVWDFAPDGTPPFTIHLGRVMDMAFSRHSSIALACADGTVQEWDLESQTCTNTFSAYAGPVMSVFYAIDDVLVTAGQHNSELTVWQGETLVQSVNVDPDGTNTPYRLSLDKTGAFLFVASKAHKSICVLHLASDSGPRYDYLCEFRIGHPVLHFTVNNALRPALVPESDDASVPRPAEGALVEEMLIFCIQPSSIQQYTLTPEQCYSAELAAVGPPHVAPEEGDEEVDDEVPEQERNTHGVPEPREPEPAEAEAIPTEPEPEPEPESAEAPAEVDDATTVEPSPAAVPDTPDAEVRHLLAAAGTPPAPEPAAAPTPAEPPKAKKPAGKRQKGRDTRGDTPVAVTLLQKPTPAPSGDVPSDLRPAQTDLEAAARQLKLQREREAARAIPIQTAPSPAPAPSPLPVPGTPGDAAEGGLLAELRGMEQRLSQRMERAVKIVTEKQFQRLEKESVERRKAERAQQEQLLAVVSQTVNTQLKTYVDTAVKTQLPDLVAPTVAAVTAGMEERFLKPMLKQIQKIVKTTVPQAVQETVQESFTASVSADLIQTISVRVSESVEAKVQESFASTFESSVIPAFEKACQNMFTQINTAFQSGLDRSLVQPAREARAAEKTEQAAALRRIQEASAGVERSTASVKTTLESFERVVATRSKELAQACTTAAEGLAAKTEAQLQKLSTDANQATQRAVQQLQQSVTRAMATIPQPASQPAVPPPAPAPAAAAPAPAPAPAKKRPTLPTTSAPVPVPQPGSRSAAPTPAPVATPREEAESGEEDPMVVIKAMLLQAQYEQAFTAALSASSLKLVIWLCRAVDARAVFHGFTSDLTQPVILSLIQQLGFELESETALKLDWLRQAIMALNPQDPMIADYIPKILNQIQENVTAISARTKHTQLCTVVQQLCNSILMQCPKSG